LGCEVYGRVDIILEPGDKFAVLEVNTIPGMTDTSLLPDAAKAEGITFDELVLQIVELSLQRHATKI
jgi:D-alanine-D-alanine ligase